MFLEGLLIKHIGLLNKFSLSSFAKVSTLQKAMPSPGFFFRVGSEKRNLEWNLYKKKMLYHSRNCNLDGQLQSATLLVMGGEAYSTELAWSLWVCANLQDIKKDVMEIVLDSSSLLTLTASCLKNRLQSLSRTTKRVKILPPASQQM